MFSATGAWFTDTDESVSDGKEIQFGTVSVTAGKPTISLTATDTSGKFLQGDSGTAAASFTNDSDVEILFVWETVVAGGTYVTGSGTKSEVLTYAAGAEVDITNISFSIPGEETGNAAQGQTETITVTLKVYAIQKANLGDSTPATADALIAMVTGS